MVTYAHRREGPRSGVGGHPWASQSERMYPLLMAVKPEPHSWSSLESMDAAQQPRVITKADVPLLGDRIKQVLKGDSQHRSGWEIATYLIALVLLMAASSFIWHSAAGVALKVIESVIALLVIGAVGTAVLVTLRFRS